MADPTRLFSRGTALFAAVVIVCSTMPAAQAQTQASCTFHVFSLPSSPQIYVSGVNDYGTVVGLADFGKNASPQFKAFIRYSGGGTTYWIAPGATVSFFRGRNGAGVTSGGSLDRANPPPPFLRKGCTLNRALWNQQRGCDCWARASLCVSLRQRHL